MHDPTGGGTGPEPVIALPADGEGALRRLVAALDTVVGAELPPHVLVGGLAVIANLAQAHRVTAAVAPRIAAADAFDGHPAATPRAVKFDCFVAEVRAGGGEAALPAHDRADFRQSV